MSGYQLQEDEYINPEDGLIWCSKCNTHRQIRVGKGMYARSPMVRCKCQQDEWDQEKQTWEKENQRRYISGLRNRGLGWLALWEYRFENDIYGDQKTMTYMRKLSEGFEELQGTGYILWGPHGTGKTFAAACLVNDLIDRGIPAVMRSFTDMANDLAALPPSEHQDYLNDLFRKKMVCIDNLIFGDEAPVAFRMKKMIMERWRRSNCLTVFTTAYSIKAMKCPKDDTEAEIFADILSRCIPIGCEGSDLRKEQASKRMREMRDFLEKVESN